VVEVLDYYPFGSVRLDNKYTAYENDKKFTGYELDASGLYYAGQRYYNSEIGRFMSVDPVYFAGCKTQFETLLVHREKDYFVFCNVFSNSIFKISGMNLFFGYFLTPDLIKPHFS